MSSTKMLDRKSQRGGKPNLIIYGEVTEQGDRCCMSIMTLYDADLPTATDPAIVYDRETEARIQIHPDDLLEHFKAHPLHVVDLCKQPGTVCQPCASRNRAFKYFLIDKGHPML
ncbi:hypothetical protein PsorP6_013940 [Peronosclerospora sorghi]|uniref:Uncharacterized protein n=1 Tax=Peronosclerospora sorghi TaxID=230839 RepID=A0ACC0VHR1_9STRA|nr:hypothetical protein PsorP6_013940 [Peronosclerospora sorghi]